VHLHLQKLNGTDPTRAWLMTHPDRTKFYFDTEGYQTATADNNGNTLLFTYEVRQSNNKPIKFLTYLTDATGRQTLTIDYFRKGENYQFIDDAGTKVSAANLTNPHIIDQIQSVTDVDGRTLTVTYTDKGLLAELVDGAGSSLAKTFRFGYDMTQGNKNVKLVSVVDPRANAAGLSYATDLAYYDLPEDDPKFHWWAKTITDREANSTGFAYLDPDGSTGSQIQTTLTDPEGHATVTLLDGFGRSTQITNAKGEVTRLAWDADNNVTRLEEPNGAFTTWTYDQNTGYPLTIRDPEANNNNTPPTTLTYQTTLDGHVADLTSKTSPEGRSWAFGYDTLGNLTAVTDPKGTATPDPDDFTTSYTYDSLGQMLTATDANGHTTSFSSYHDSGYPQTITDPLGNDTTFTYDARGNVLAVTDPQPATSSYEYDLFGRPGESRVPKSATDTIVTPAPVYDRNDNVTTAFAPNGAVTGYAYQKTDRMVETILPPDSPTGPQRKISYAYDRVGNLISQTEPKGNLTTGDPDDFVTSYGYDPIYQLTSATNADGDRISYAYDNVGNVTTVVDPHKNATTDPADFTTRYTYDRAHRVLTVTDAAGHAASTGYDLDGNVTSTTDRQGATTLISLDERAMPAEVKVPHADNGGTTTYRITRYEYDQVGNRTRTITPRGVEAAGDPDDFTAATVYDELNRVAEQVLPFDPDDPRYNTPDKIIYSYDDAGRLARVSAPPSEGQSVRNDTTYTHFLNGWVKTSTEPWDITTSYDYNPLGQQTSRILTSAGGSSERAMAWTYLPDGKLATRSDDGVPVGRQVVLVDNSDSQNVTTVGSWAAATTGSGFQGHNYQTNAAGSGTDRFTWKLNIPQDGTYQVFVKYPQVAGAATNAAFTVAHAGGTTVETVDQSANAGGWVSLGSFAFSEAAGGQRITLSDQASGTVVADAVKLVRDNSGETDTEGKAFAYTYDANGNLVSLTDGPSSTSHTIGYDGLNRVTSVQADEDGRLTTTSYTYDPNGNPLTRDHDQQDATYTYDPRDLLDRVSITEPGESAKTTSYTYTPNGWRLQEVKANGNTVDYTYFLDGLLRTQTEKKPDATLVAEHALTYNPNGHKASDISQVMDADNHGDYLDRTVTYTYDPLDRIAQLTRTDTSTGQQVSAESYTHDANNNVVAQTIDDVTTTFTYDRNRLLSSTTAGVSSAYNYDPFGRLDTVTAAGQILERYRYDGFDRVAEHRKLQESGATATTRYGYDPMDRTTTRTENAGTAGEETIDFAYLGLSDQLVTEEIGGQLTRSYQYSPWGQRLSQVTHEPDGTSEDSFYGYTPHTDVETLTNRTGETRATYGYTAYGDEEEDAFTGVDVPDPANPDAEPYNVYRYTAKRFDSASGDYDMGFRDYDPGLNRFISRDTYNGALADLNLAVSPWTGNRYALAGGNPITGIEIDGHEPRPWHDPDFNPDTFDYDSYIAADSSTGNDYNGGAIASILDALQGGTIGGIAAKLAANLKQHAQWLEQRNAWHLAQYLDPNATPESRAFHNSRIWSNFLKGDRAIRHSRQLLRTVGARVPIIGLGVSAVGIVVDIGQGKPVEQAVVSGAGGAAAGLAIGGAIGSVVPVAGTAVGAVVGAGVGWAVSSGIDWLYENPDTVENWVSTGTDAVGGAAGAVASGAKDVWNSVFGG
jgi:RHS repeat-associated protein